jgi:hypothetical protein
MNYSESKNYTTALCSQRLSYWENYMLNTTLCCFCVGYFAFGIHTKDNTRMHDLTPTQQVDKNIKK